MNVLDLIGNTLYEGSMAVTMLCDHGTRYPSEPFWEESK
jgi:hypothetical protein